ncbi:MAG: tetratricopeptide repeat protein [Acidobacteriota bacterium]|nr:MAG: tetratricopeptide repeat protein [Acidobacteriota bacterium]
MRVELKLKSLAARTVFAFGFLAVLLLFIFSILTLLGNAVARGAGEPAAAEFAASIAPNEPFAYYAAGWYLERSMRPEDLPRSLEMYEKAAALEPNDYLLWLEFGKALERNGKPEEAEKALRHAAETAPNYSEVLWTLGNVLIRNGKDEEGFAHIRRAVEGNSKFGPPAASLAWDLFEGDIDRVIATVGDSSAVKAAMAGFLARQEKYREAIAMWKSLPGQEIREEHREAGNQLLQTLLGAKRYAAAAEVQAMLSDDGPKVAEVTNGGFEKDVSVDEPGVFEWNIQAGKNPAVGISVEQKREGGKSLALIFEGRSTGAFRTISQAVAVLPGVEYRFEAFLKTELETDKTMFWEIADAVSGEVLASTPAVPASSGWAPVSAVFSTKDGSEGVIIRLVREKCVGSECRIAGRAWIDGVSIKKVEQG